MTGRRMRRSSAVVGAVVVVGVALMLPLASGLRFFGLDHTRNLLPMTCAFHQAIGSSFETLALDAALGGGSPLLQDPEGLVFSPLSWLFLPASPETAASLFTWVWLVVAAGAAAWLARSFGLSARAASCFGVAHALSGTSVNLIVHGPHVVGAALLPLAWAGARMTRRAANPTAGILSVVVALGLLPLHGAFQVALWCGLLGIAEGVVAVLQRRHRRAVLLGLALAAGSLIACLQLLPALDLHVAAARAHGGVDLAMWPLELPEAFGVVLPHVAFLHSSVDATLVQAWNGSRMARAGWNVDPFLGVSSIIAVAAIIVVATGRARRSRPVAAIAITSLLLALGEQTPVYRVLVDTFPPFQLFRYPAKYFQLTSLAALLLAFTTLDACARDGHWRRLIHRLGVFWSCALAGIIVGLTWARHHIDDAESSVAGRLPHAAAAPLGEILVVAGIAALAFCVLVTTTLRDARRARFAPFIIVAELAFAAWNGGIRLSSPWLDAARPPAPELPETSQLCSGRSLYAIHVDGAFGPLDDEGDLLGDFVDHKADFAQCRGPVTPHDFLSTSQRVAIRLSRGALDEEKGVFGPAFALGCTHIASRGTVGIGVHREPQPNAPSFAAPIYALDAPLPLSGIVPKPTLVDDEEELIARLTAARTADEVAGLIDDPTKTFRGPLWSGEGVAVGVVRVDRVDKATVELQGRGGAIVFLRRSWWPGWRAEQAGRSLPVVRVAGVQLGVVVADASAGSIHLHYAVPGLLPGVACAITGILVAFFTLWCARRGQAMDGNISSGCAIGIRP
jgi:hypothetical protein